MNHTDAAAGARRRSGPLLIAGAAIALAVLLLYAPAGTFDFVTLDDGDFVTENPVVRAGLTPAGVRWSLTAVHASNWQPVTWWSHMLDVSLFGLDAGAHHLVSVALHALNAALLLALLHRLTGSLLPAFLATALFALHPLRVESVAWVSERKDLLGAALWLLATLAYVAWCRRRSAGGYLLVFALAALGLMAKQMVVTLPLTLLLLDAWPLGRSVGPRGEPWGRLIREKTPLFALAAAGAAIALYAQHAGGTLATLAHRTPLERLQTSLVGYAWYAGKWLWPSGLAVLRLPPEQGWSTTQVLLCALVPAGGTVAALASRHRRPHLTMGWFWFLATLTPVIGLVQVGSQATADRYGYIPLIGLAVAVSWTIGGRLQHRRQPLALGVGAFAVAAALASATAAQLSHWRNSEALFTRAVAVNPRNFAALNNLGEVYATQRRWADAALQYQRAVIAAPDEGYPRYNLGLALEALGRPEEAVPEFEAALRALNAPRERAEAHRALARVLLRLGRNSEAFGQLEQAR